MHLSKADFIFSTDFIMDGKIFNGKNLVKFKKMPFNTSYYIIIPSKVGNDLNCKLSSAFIVVKF